MMENSVRRGPPPGTHRQVLALALPMMLSNVTTPLLGLVAATAVGRLGDARLLGAVALGAAIFDFLFWSFGALRMATAGLTAQAAGAGTLDEVDRALARGLLVAITAGCILILVQTPVGNAAFALMDVKAPLVGPLEDYYFTRIWAAPFTLVNYVVLGSTIGRGRTDIGLILQVGINITNIVLTVLLVSVFGLGVKGSAFAAVSAETMGSVFGLIVLMRLGSVPHRVPIGEVFDARALKRTLALNGDIMIRTMALILAFGLFLKKGNQAGEIVLAANAVLYNIYLMGGYLLDGFATAAEVMCGRAVGANEETAFRRSVRLGLLWCCSTGLVMSVVFYVGGGLLIDMVSTGEAVREEARRYLPFAAISPFIGAMAFAFDGVFIGATWTSAMRNLMLAAFAVYLLALWVGAGYGNSGLWLAFLTFIAARGAGQALAYPGLVRRRFSERRGSLLETNPSNTKT